MTYEKYSDIPVTTTPDFQGKEIKKYLGIVCAEKASSINVLLGRKMLASYENSLFDTREEALKDIQDQAKALGANAIVGIDINYDVLGQTNIIMVSVSGTAVVI